jgi:hypothetical protein
LLLLDRIQLISVEVESVCGSVVDELLLDLLSLSKDELGKSASDVFSEGFVFLVVVLLNGISYFVEDVFTVDDEVLANVVSEGGWTVENGYHLGELGPVASNSLACSNFVLHFGNSNCKMLKAIESVTSVVAFEILDCNLNIIENDVWSSEASLDVFKTLSFDSA